MIVGGRAGAELFYDQSRLQRDGAMPALLTNSLFGKGAVHGLDGAEHRHRKQLFLSLLTEQAAVEISEHAAIRWTEAVAEVCSGEHLNLFDAAVRVHCAARQLVEQARHGELAPARDSAFCAIAEHRDAEGGVLPTAVAAVELLNILRPTVAAAWFVSFTALALHDRPELADGLRRADDATLEAFAHELRRLYPFVSLLGARAGTDFDWNAAARPARSPCPAGRLRHAARPGSVARAGRVAAGSVRRHRAGSVHAHPAGRRRRGYRPPLSGRACHDRADQDGAAVAHIAAL